MTFTQSLKSNRDFQKIFKNGKSKANKYFVMYVANNEKNINRLGISVSKKVGNSVVRHYIKRCIKEAYRLHENMFNSGLDIVVIARQGASDISYHEIESAILHLMRINKVFL